MSACAEHGADVVNDVIGHCRPFDRKGVSDRVDELMASYIWDKTRASPSTPLGYSSTTVTAWSPTQASANRGRGRGPGRVPGPDSGQIGDGDRGASPPPGKSGTDAPSPSPDKSGTVTGTGGVSVR